MDKNNITFLILCIIIILGTFGIYKYNTKKYETQSTMMVVSIEEGTQVIGSSSNKTDTSTSTKNSMYKIIENTTITTTNTNIVTISTTFDTTISTKQSTDKSNASTSKSTIKTTTTTELITEPTFPISLNSITFDELQYIKGIGEVTAQKIIDYRNSIGYFTSRYQLLEINGIGESKMNTIMEYTYIENEDLNYNQAQEEVEIIEEPSNVEMMEVDIINDTSYIEETPIITIEETQVTENPYPINLNTATLDDLLLIPNMTSELAQEILNLRETIKYYSNTYELLYINGISETYLREIINYISVE